MCLNLCYFGLWTPKWRKILPCRSAGSARAAALAGSCPGRYSAARPRTAGLHKSVSGIRQVQQMLNRSLCANFIAAKLPKHLLLVVVRLNAPAELVELERVNRHMLGAGVAEPLDGEQQNSCPSGKGNSREIIGNLVQHQAFTILWWTACRRIRQLEHGRIVACIADYVEIRIAESMCKQLALSAPAIEEQDYLAFFKD